MGEPGGKWVPYNPAKLTHPAEVTGPICFGLDEDAADKAMEAVDDAYRAFARFLAAQAALHPEAAVLLKELEETVEEARRR